MRKNVPLTNKLQELHEKAKFCYISQKIFKDNTLRLINIVQLETIDLIQVNVEVLHIAYAIYNIIYLNNVLWFFIKDQTAIIILS